LSRSVAWIVAAIAALWLALPSRAGHAHEFRPAMLVIEAHAGGEVSVRFSPPTVTARGPTTGALRPVPPEHCGVAGPQRWSCGAEGLTGTLTVAGLHTDPVDVLVHVRWPDGAELRARLDPETPSLVLPRGAAVAGGGQALAVYFALGGEHVLGGADHLLFLLALLLLGGRSSDHVRTITAFTIGHGIALVAQTVHPVAVPGPWVEACITASIAAASAQGLRSPAPRTAAWPWALACGLVHGLGFAGALAELGLPPAHRGSALLGFNLGVEAGQLAVVLVLWAVAAAVCRAPARRERWRRAFAGAVGSVAVAWTIERVASFWEPFA
jgi:hypothetical protein